MSNETTPLPTTWRLTPFNQLATYDSGRTPARAVPEFWAAHAAEGTPWVSIADMRPYAQVRETAERITPRALREVFRNRISKRGTLIMSFKLTIGRVATLGLDACHNEAIISIFPNARVNQKYLEYFLSQVDYADYQDRAVKGNTLNQEKINRIAVAEPQKLEQEKIAAVLWKVQRAMEVEAKLVATARELKQSAMRQLFTLGLRGEPQKETEIGPIPTSWVMVPAERIFKLTSGSKRPAGLSLVRTPETPCPVLGGNGVMGYSSEWFLDTDVSLVIGRVGEYCGAVHLARGKVWITDNALYAKQWLNDAVLVDYIAEFLAYYDLNRFKRMAGQPLVSQGLINEHKFPVPSLDEQKEIAVILQTMDRKISVHERKRAALSDLFQTLLHQLMTAQIRVHHLDIDTSEVTA